MAQELEAYFSLTPDQRDKIRMILNRCFEISLMDVQDHNRKELHVISARNGIICLLDGWCWHVEDISNFVRQEIKYVEKVITLYKEELDRRKYEDRHKKSND